VSSETIFPLLIAHRGSSRKAPENTLAAFRLAWHELADGIEADFRLTGDGRIVCMHDRTTRRTTGTDLDVSGSSWEQLRTLDAGSWKGIQWRGERIPLLQDILAAVPAGKHLFIELKAGRELIHPLAKVLSGWEPAAGRLRILSFSKEVLLEVKRQLPEFRTCLVADLRRRGGKPWRPSKQEVLDIMQYARADGLAGRAGYPFDADLVRLLRQAEKEVHVWTVNRPREAYYYWSLVDSIITDHPGYLRQVLSRMYGGNTDYREE